MSTDIELVQTALVEFDRVGAGLAQLQKNYAGMLYDVETPNGMTMAKAARQAVRQPRYDVERIRKEAKAPLLAIGKKLDAEAARITTELLKLEEPIDQQIKNEESRKERERAEAAAKEAARVAALQGRVAAIRTYAIVPTASGSAYLQAQRDKLAAVVVDESFQEFQSEANAAKEQTAAILFGLYTAEVEAEKERARVLAERAELEKLRAEQAAREKAEQERQAEESRREREQLDRERAQQEAAAKAERDRIAAEESAARKRIKDQQREADRLRKEADDKARKEREVAEAELKRQQDALAAEREAARAHAERERTAKQQEQRDQITNLVSAHYQISEVEASELLAQLFG